MFDALVRFVRAQYRTADFIPLHAPVFAGHENEYVAETIASTFVSSVGTFVDRFERDMAGYTGSPRAIATAARATMNGHDASYQRWRRSSMSDQPVGTTDSSR